MSILIIAFVAIPKHTNYYWLAAVWINFLGYPFATNRPQRGREQNNWSIGSKRVSEEIDPPDAAQTHKQPNTQQPKRRARREKICVYDVHTRHFGKNIRFNETTNRESYCRIQK